MSPPSSIDVLSRAQVEFIARLYNLKPSEVAALVRTVENTAESVRRGLPGYSNPQDK